MEAPPEQRGGERSSVVGSGGGVRRRRAQKSRYLDPENFRPYNGPVLTVYRDAPDAIEISARRVDGRLAGAY